MGIHDREYYEFRSAGEVSLRRRSVVGTLIAANVVIWVLQLLIRGDDAVLGGTLTRFLACTPADIFDGFPHVWKLLTANFAHDWRTPWHLAGNMIFLLFFGSDLEQLLGRRDFCLLYFGSGILAIAAEVVSQQLTGNGQTLILGASGAVMAIVVLYTCLFPTRRIYLFFVLPLPVWALCTFFIFQDVARAFGAGEGGVACFAHLVGAACGFAFWRWDLRWETISRLGRRLGRAEKRGARPGPRLIETAEADGDSPGDAISQRIDELLDKIHVDGMEGLTAEERSFLEENASRYRRP